MIEAKYSFDKGGACVFNTSKETSDEYLIGFLNSKLAGYIVSCLNPTVNRQVGDIRRVPIVKPSLSEEMIVSKLADIAVSIKKFLCTTTV
jgi:hypothetical protein